MRRREFIAFAAGATMWPLAAHAQQAEGMAHVGVLGPSLDLAQAKFGYQALSAELQKLGFTQGKNLQLDYRRTDQGMDLAIAAGRELVAAKANVIVATGPEISLRSALAPNSGLPIVILAFNYDPIARGYVESLAHPGGNITGLFTRQPELAVKQLQLLAEAFPGKDKLGVFWDDQTAEQFASAEQEAKKMQLAMTSIKLMSPHMISRRRSVPPKTTAFKFFSFCRARYSLHMGRKSQIWQCGTGFRRCSPSKLMSRPAV